MPLDMPRLQPHAETTPRANPGDGYCVIGLIPVPPHWSRTGALNVPTEPVTRGRQNVLQHISPI